MVDDAKQFMGFVHIDKDEFVDLLHKVRVALPDEVRKASRITAESERIIGSARETAEQTMMDSQQEANRIQQAAQNSAEKLANDTEQRAQHRIQESETAAARILGDANSQAGQIVQQAQQEAEKTVLNAHQQAEQLISESEILRAARAQAKEIIAAAEYDALGISRGAEEYAREELARLEKVLSDGLLTVQKGRMKLDQRLGNEPAAHSSAPPRNGRNAESTYSRR